MAAYVVLLITVTVAPVSTSIVILFSFMSIVTICVLLHPELDTLLVVLQTPYLLIPNDVSSATLPVCIRHYLPTPPLGQDMTQGQFLSGV